MRKQSYVIGVTGNTGAGKSTAANALRKVGVRVIDADIIARELQQPGQSALREITEIFGADMLQQDGTLDRKKLGALVFSDPTSLKKLDSIMWPRILKEIQQQIILSQEDVVIDAPLLYETGMQVLCHETWLVVAPEMLRCQRIMRRDNITLEQAQARMKSQLPQDYKRSLATHILDGGKTPEELEQMAVDLYHKALEAIK